MTKKGHQKIGMPVALRRVNSDTVSIIAVVGSASERLMLREAI